MHFYAFAFKRLKDLYFHNVSFYYLRCHIKYKRGKSSFKEDQIIGDTSIDTIL